MLLDNINNSVFIQVVKEKGQFTGREREIFYVTHDGKTDEIFYGRNWNFTVYNRLYQFKSSKNNKDIMLENPEGKQVKIFKRGCYINLSTFERE